MVCISGYCPGSNHEHTTKKRAPLVRNLCLNSPLLNSIFPPLSSSRFVLNLRSTLAWLLVLSFLHDAQNYKYLEYYHSPKIIIRSILLQQKKKKKARILKKQRKKGREERREGGREKKEHKACFEGKCERKGPCLRKRRRKTTVMCPFRLLLM